MNSVRENQSHGPMWEPVLTHRLYADFITACTAEAQGTLSGLFDFPSFTPLPVLGVSAVNPCRINISCLSHKWAPMDFSRGLSVEDRLEQFGDLSQRLE